MDAVGAVLAGALETDEDGEADGGPLRVWIGTVCTRLVLCADELLERAPGELLLLVHGGGGWGREGKRSRVVGDPLFRVWEREEDLLARACQQRGQQRER
jgi:hypothetical protein